MAKFHGVVGYIETKETMPGVYTEVVTERICKGDILRNSQRFESSDKINEDFTISNTFSILTDEYMHEHIPYIRYLTWNGTKWKVSSVEIMHPRIRLSVGGVYNG